MSKKLFQATVMMCAFWVPISFVHAQKTGNTGLQCYTPGKDFQRNDDPDCFKITSDEAKKAFAKGCWEDASKLYRSAKLCRDATQKNRNEMNTAIKACADAAEAALQAERDKAIRQAREAIASNRANDAQDMLRKNDRSTAYRLAKFANDFISPVNEDNPDCLQAIFDAWQQKAPASDQKIQPILPFCYELMHTEEGDSMTVHFSETKGEIHLFAFSLKRHELYEWKAPEFALLQTTKIDSTMRDFDLAPDGETMVFHSPTAFLLIKNGKKYPFPNLLNTDAYCFSSDSKTFFYFDQSQMSVMSNAFDNSPIQQKEKRSTKIQTTSIDKNAFRVSSPPTCLGFANNHIWLVRHDSVAFYQPVSEKSGKTGWIFLAKTALNFPAHGLTNTEKSQIMVNSRDHIITASRYDTFQYSTVIYSNGSYSSVPGQIQKGILLSEQKVWLSDNAASPSLYFQRSDSLIQSIHLDDFTNAHWGKSASMVISEDPFNNMDEWLAVADGWGLLKLWRLSGNFSGKFKKIFSAPGYVTCSEDGSSLANCTKGLPAEYYSINNNLERFGNIPALSDYEITAEVSNTGWIAVSSYDTSAIFLYNHHKHFTVDRTQFSKPLFLFDYTGQYFVYAVEYDSLDVFQLQGDEIQHIAGRRFDASISQICFIPTKDALIVQRFQEEGEGGGSISIPKIWHFKSPERPLELIRMENVFTAGISTNSSGEHLYFTDASSVRIFNTNNLTDESASIREKKGVFIEAIAGHPTAKIIAVGYSDGTIACCDATTGKKLFHLVARYEKNEQSDDVFTRLAFVHGGDQLIAVINNKNVQYFDLNIEHIQQQISLKGGQLVAFAPEQIGHWDLDKALEYEGNFTRLAKSGDQPLIYAFFNFFIRQARYSNRIDEVKNYCKRAADLYDLLDPESKKAQKTTMLSMYDIYLWKLLQRNKLDEAELVIKQLDVASKFKSALPLMRASGHIALLRKDLKTAARLYIDWMINFKKVSESDYQDYTVVFQVSDELTQFNEYGNLGPDQRELVCAVFKDFQFFSESFCAESDADLYLQQLLKDDPTYQRWKLFQLLQQSTDNYRVPFVIQLERLKGALTIAQKLQANGRGERTETEKITLKVADLYKKIGVFESSSSGTEAGRYFTKGIDLLESASSFPAGNETSRLDTLGKLYLLRGNSRLPLHPEQALEDYERCYRSTFQLESIYSLRKVNSEIGYYYVAWQSLIQSGKALLLLDRPAEARDMFEKAGEIYDSPVNGINMAHSYLLEGEEIKAFLNFGFIKSENDLANALADIRQYSIPLKKQPARFDQIQQLTSRMKNAWFSNHPESDNAYVESLFQKRMISDFSDSGQYDSAYIWSRNMLLGCRQAYKAAKDQPERRDIWLDLLTNSTINYTQYSLFLPNISPERLNEALGYSREVLQEAKSAYLPDKSLLYLNNGHICLLLGNTEQALESYELFDVQGGGAYAYFDYLLKDWRDLYRAGIHIKALKEVVNQIFPADYPFSPEDLQAINQD
jgi:hypothetical protein